MRDVGAAGMLDKLGRGEGLAVADAQDADLRLGVAVEEPRDRAPVGPVPGRRHARHSREERVLVLAVIRSWHGLAAVSRGAGGGCGVRHQAGLGSARIAVFG